MVNIVHNGRFATLNVLKVGKMKFDKLTEKVSNDYSKAEKKINHYQEYLKELNGGKEMNFVISSRNLGFEGYCKKCSVEQLEKMLEIEHDESLDKIITNILNQKKQEKSI